MAEKSKKMSKLWIYLGVTVAIVLIVAALLIIFRGNDKEVKAVMECDLNPNIQLLLNANDKVVGVNALNEDGEALVVNVDFVGLSADEAGKLFVEVSSQAGKFNLNSTNSADGKKVEFTIQCENEADYDKLKDKVVQTVNKYFDENGIIAGAVANISTDLTEALSSIQIKASEYAEMTEAEMLALLQERSENLKDVSLELRSDLLNGMDNLYNTILAAAEQAFEFAKESVKSAEQALNEAPEILKETYQTALDQAKKVLANAEKEFDRLKAELEKEIDKLIKTIRTQSETAIAQIKTTWNNLLEQKEAILNDHKTFVAEHSEAVQAAIDAYRATLTA